MPLYLFSITNPFIQTKLNFFLKLKNDELAKRTGCELHQLLVSGSELEVAEYETSRVILKLTLN